MEFTIYSIIYFFTAVLAFIVGVLAWKRKYVLGAKELFLLTQSVLFCAFFLFFESASTTSAGKVFWSKISYLGAVTTPVFYFLFVLRFTRLVRFKDMKGGWLLFVFPFITLMLALTNEHHHLLWSGFSPVFEVTNLMKYEHGLWFWVGYTSYSYIMLLLATYYLFEFIRNNRKKKDFRYQGRIVIIGGLLPWTVSVLYISGINPVTGLDITPISTTISAILFTYAMLRNSFLNLVPVAREKLVETLPIGIIALDDKNRIQDINQIARSFLEIKKDDVSGMTPSQFGSGPLLNAVISSEPSLKVELTDDSGFKSYQFDKQPLKALPGSRLITIYDITEQITREKELYEAKKKAEESDNLKSAFLANMSHEIRTPMNSIMGFISILQEGNLTEEEIKEYLEIVKSNGDRLLKTLNDIVDISKIESNQITMNYSNFDINELLSDMYGLFKPEAEIKGLEYDRPVVIPQDQSYIRTDKDKLYSIFINIIKNALKYTINGFVRYGCSVSETHLYFSVSDSGIGIPSEKHQAVFERFIQVDSSRKRTYEGSGLGLAITKAYVEMMGGKIRLESEEDEGSTFFVEIPVEHVQPIV